MDDNECYVRNVVAIKFIGKFIHGIYIIWVVQVLTRETSIIQLLGITKEF